MVVLGNRVLVRLIKENSENKTPGGIYIPENEFSKYAYGVVIKVGEGRVSELGHIIKCNVKEGDCIVYERFAGNPIVINGETFHMVNGDNVVGVGGGGGD